MERGIRDMKPLRPALLLLFIDIKHLVQPRVGQLKLDATGDCRPSEAGATILLRTPDGALVVEVARGLDRCRMVELAHHATVRAPLRCRLGYRGVQC